MADISSFKPNGAGGASYNFKDTTARNNISTLSNTVNNLGTRVTALENSGGGISFWVADEVDSEPYEDWGLSDCDYAIIYEESVWDYDDNDNPILRTYYPTRTYYRRSDDSYVKVGNVKAGDIIVVEEYNSRSFYGTLPANETIGYVNNSPLLSELDSRYQKQSPPAPDPVGNTFSVHGSGNSVNLGNMYYSTKSFYYVTGLTTITRPSEEFSGKTNTYKLAKCFKMI